MHHNISRQKCKVCTAGRKNSSDEGQAFVVSHVALFFHIFVTETGYYSASTVMITLIDCANKKYC